VNGFLNGLPHAIVVENADAELAIVTPALGPILVPFKDVNGQERPPQLLFNRPQASSKGNAATSASVSHYIYPIHLSKTFLCTPTIESAIYLLLNRMIHKQYPDAFQLAESCVSDVVTTSGEASYFWVSSKTNVMISILTPLHYVSNYSTWHLYRVIRYLGIYYKSYQDITTN